MGRAEAVRTSLPNQLTRPDRAPVMANRMDLREGRADDQRPATGPRGRRTAQRADSERRGRPCAGSGDSRVPGLAARIGTPRSRCSAAADFWSRRRCAAGRSSLSRSSRSSAANVAYAIRGRARCQSTAAKVSQASMKARCSDSTPTKVNGSYWSAKEQRSNSFAARCRSRRPARLQTRHSSFTYSFWIISLIRFGCSWPTHRHCVGDAPRRPPILRLGFSRGTTGSSHRGGGDEAKSRRRRPRLTP